MKSPVKTPRWTAIFSNVWKPRSPTCCATRWTTAASRPKKRQRAGKPPAGVIRLEAHHSAGMLLVTVADDGAGIDMQNSPGHRAEKTGHRAGRRKTAPTRNRSFLFRPGFTMKETVTEISGRGGLDIVLSMAKNVRGTVRVSTQPGRGRASTPTPLRFPFCGPCWSRWPRRALYFRWRKLTARSSCLANWGGRPRRAVPLPRRYEQPDAYCPIKRLTAVNPTGSCCQLSCWSSYRLRAVRSFPWRAKLVASAARFAPGQKHQRRSAHGRWLAGFDPGHGRPGPLD